MNITQKNGCSNESNTFKIVFFMKHPIGDSKLILGDDHQCPSCLAKKTILY